MLMHKTCNENGEWLQGDDNIDNEACNYNKNMFTGKTNKICEESLHCIPRMVTQEQNTTLERML